MIIAVICDVLGRENNGTTIAANNLIRYLRGRGHTVRVVCSDESKAGMTDYYIVPKFNFGPLNGYVKKNGVAPARVDRKVLEQALADVDLIHVMLPFAVGKAAAKYAHKHGIPLTAGFHCQAENVTNHLHMKDFGLANHIAYKAFYRRLYRYCDCIHYPTAFIRDVFETVVGPTPGRVISNGVNSAFVPKEAKRPKEFRNRFIVLFTGRYSIEKSHRILIDGVARSKYRDRIQLIFAGTGPLEGVLRRRSRRRGINMPVMKFYSRGDLVDVINMADLYIHPAEIEIEAISCLEAIACGRVPLIADSPRSATRYFALSDNNLFRCNDPDDLAAKLDWWIEHPEEIRKSEQQYLGYSAQFDFAHCMSEMERMMIETREEKLREA